MQTIVNVQVRDQTLQVNAPKLASGNVNAIKMVFSFCPLWDGFGKTAVFYRDHAEVYKVLIDYDNSCIVPHELAQEPGSVYFGVFGAKDDVVRTTEVLTLKLLQGPPMDGTTPEEPTPDIYQQLLTELANVGELALEAKATAEEALSKSWDLDNVKAATEIVETEQTIASGNTDIPIDLFTAPSNGFYFINMCVQWDTKPGGWRNARLTTMDGGELIPVSDASSMVHHTLSDAVYLPAGNQVQLMVRQTSGVELKVVYFGRYSYIPM